MIKNDVCFREDFIRHRKSFCHEVLCVLTKVYWCPCTKYITNLLLVINYKAVSGSCLAIQSL